MAFKTQYSVPACRADTSTRTATSIATASCASRPRATRSCRCRTIACRSNRAYLVIVLLSRVITKLGEHKHITVDMIENLFSTDLAYLQEFYRKINEEGGRPSITSRARSASTRWMSTWLPVR